MSGTHFEKVFLGLPLRLRITSLYINVINWIQFLQSIVKQMNALYRIFWHTHIRINVPEYEHYVYRNWVNRWIMPLVSLRAKLLIWTRWRSYMLFTCYLQCPKMLTSLQRDDFRLCVTSSHYKTVHNKNEHYGSVKI